MLVRSQLTVIKEKGVYGTLRDPGKYDKIIMSKVEDTGERWEKNIIKIGVTFFLIL